MAAGSDDKHEPQAALVRGDWAAIKGMSRRGRIVSIDAARGQADVECGSLLWTLPLGALSRADPPAGLDKDGASRTGRVTRTRRGVAHEIDLHGMRVKEALEVLDKFLDSAIVDHLDEVKVIHGHGTGRVRSAIRAMLADHPHVGDFHFGGPERGGLAATIVKMRRPGG